MNSRFLQLDDDFLERLGNRIRYMADIIKPIYVSDHIGLFYHNDLMLQSILEIDFNDICYTDKIIRWQQILERPLLLENSASHYLTHGSQIKFFENLKSTAGCDILFDISNAVVARINGNETEYNWLEILKDMRHYHIAGYEFSLSSSPPLALDTHSASLSSSTANFLSTVVEVAPGGSTLVLEWDGHCSYETAVKELNVISALVEDNDNS